MKLRFEQAKIVADNYDVREYLKTEAPRGQPSHVMTRSSLLCFDDCPSKWIRGWTRKDSDATQFGSLLDCLLLDSGRFNARYALRPDTYVNDDEETKPWNGNAKVCKKWKEEVEVDGAEIVTQSDFALARSAQSRISYDAEIALAIETSRHQVLVTGIYVDPETQIKVPVKALVDLLHDRWAGDFKTAAYAHPSVWPKTVATYGYHVQGAIILDLLASAGEEREEFRHIIQENEPPFEIGTRYLTVEFIEYGRMKYLQALQRYCLCLANNDWPSYDPSGNSFGRWSECAPPSWMKEVAAPSQPIKRAPEPARQSDDVIP